MGSAPSIAGASDKVKVGEGAFRSERSLSTISNRDSDTPKSCEASAEATSKPRPDYAAQTEMDKRVIATLKEMNKKRLAEGKSSSVMNRVLLNFPRLAKTFKDLHRLYEEVDTDGSGDIDLDEVKVLMRKLNSDMTDKDMSAIFNQSSVLSDGRICFKEFLTCLSLGYIFDLIPDLNRENPTEYPGEENELFADKSEVRRVFKLATELYLAFDSSCSGIVTFDDMEKVINGGTGVSEMTKDTRAKGKTTKRISSRRPSLRKDEKPNNSPIQGLLSRDRWKELDWDSDGFITYQEFMCTFVKWVSSLSGDDDDEEEEAA